MPTARGLPLLGSALDLRRDFLGTMTRAMREQGDVVRFLAGPPGRMRLTMYAAFHPDDVQRVLSTESASYRKDSWIWGELAGWFGDGVLTSQDERWARQRRLIQPIFTLRRVASYVSVMAEETRRVVDRWHPTADAGGEVDLHLEMMRVTLRVVARVLFGSDIDEAIPVIHRAFPVIGKHVLNRATSPFRPPQTWPTPGNRRAARAKRELVSVCDQLVARRRSSSTGGTDLLSALLEARDPETGKGLDDAGIRDQLLIFLLAGHETTATTLTFSFNLLGRHPEAQDRIRREADAVLGDREPRAEDIPTLVYTGMVIKEAMRLYPPVFANGRLTARGDRMRGYDIPPGSEVILSPWATHRHPGFWEDPEHFDPERFRRERESERHRYAYFPFGGGPRACLGQHFSSMEAAVVISSLIRAYELTSSPEPPEMDPALTLRCRVPPRCQVRPR
ncbi:MAG: cytochrome P450 [Acidimicrobiia bacterium]